MSLWFAHVPNRFPLLLMILFAQNHLMAKTPETMSLEWKELKLPSCMMINPELEFEWAAQNEERCQGVYGEGHISRVPGITLLSTILWEQPGNRHDQFCMKHHGSASAICEDHDCVCLCAFRDQKKQFLLGQEIRNDSGRLYCQSAQHTSVDYLLAYCSEDQPLTMLEAFEHKDPIDYVNLAGSALLLSSLLYMSANIMVSYFIQTDLLSFLIGLGYVVYLRDPKLLAMAFRKS
ncbi:hypothetical protein [Endozoicomonas arenosclerae]|uniref:hypothetical protein n=1 Tax=Endozoicomonas arenosclerae TaxID=1633495 RepID=UPI000AC41B40|nr:hypothetical protein [Endozoicomonas arenosclerae]